MAKIPLIQFPGEDVMRILHQSSLLGLGGRAAGAWPAVPAVGTEVRLRGTRGTSDAINATWQDSD